MAKQNPNLLKQVHQVIQQKNHSARTEESYISWIKQYILFHNKQHPNTMGHAEVEAFLRHLAVKKQMADSTQKQALNALRFLYRDVLGKPLEKPIKLANNAKKQAEAKQLTNAKSNLTLITPAEAWRVIDALSGNHKLMAKLLYGSGLRVSECVRLRVRDIDFEQLEIVVWDNKYKKKRVTILPQQLVDPLQEHLEQVKIIYSYDLSTAYGGATLPASVEKTNPTVSHQWTWQYVFPAKSVSKEAKTGRIRRHHLHANTLQKAIKQGVKLASINKNISSNTFRHSFAFYLLENGHDIYTVQKLLGHKDITSMLIYMQLLKKDDKAVESPIDQQLKY